MEPSGPQAPTGHLAGAPHHILRSTLMNKFAKGSVAAGAGLVLLLGGAGTLAYWNDSAELANGSINAGTLTLEADNDLLAASIAEQPALWVPGDEHTFSTELTLAAEGDNISGDLQLDAERSEEHTPEPQPLFD